MALTSRGSEGPRGPMFRRRRGGTAGDAECKCRETYNQAPLLLGWWLFLLVFWLPSFRDFYGLSRLYFSHKPYYFLACYFVELRVFSNVYVTLEQKWMEKNDRASGQSRTSQNSWCLYVWGPVSISAAPGCPLEGTPGLPCCPLGGLQAEDLPRVFFGAWRGLASVPGLSRGSWLCSVYYHRSWVLNYGSRNCLLYKTSGISCLMPGRAS